MNRIRLLKAADYPRMPWKNGAGSTLEILRDAGDGLDGFGWRLSIADVGQSGPFSAFTGYQRVITVLEGAGMRLTVDGQPSRDLGPLDAFAFDGGAAVDCTLIDGPIRDFNLIYAPARYAARLQWLCLDGPQSLFTSAALCVLFAADAGVGLEGMPPLGRHDSLLWEGSGSLEALRLDGAGHLCLIELLPRSN